MPIWYSSAILRTIFHIFLTLVFLGWLFRAFLCSALKSEKEHKYYEEYLDWQDKLNLHHSQYTTKDRLMKTWMSRRGIIIPCLRFIPETVLLVVVIVLTINSNNIAVPVGVLLGTAYISFIVIGIRKIVAAGKRERKEEEKESWQRREGQLENDIKYLKDKIEEATITEKEEVWRTWVKEKTLDEVKYIRDNQIGPPDDPLCLELFVFRASDMKTLLGLMEKDLQEVREQQEKL